MDIQELDDDPYEQIFYKEAVENCEHAKVKLWLLDNAIQQYSTIKCFRKKEKYLPDEVFSRPGMPEPSMVAYLVIRGAHDKCIRYARRKFKEEHEPDESETESTDMDTDAPSQSQTEHTLSSATGSRSTTFTRPFQKVKRLFATSQTTPSRQ